MMLNHIHEPAEMLAWLSERNHHIPLEDLAYMMESRMLSDFPEELNPVNFDADDFSDLCC